LYTEGGIQWAIKRLDSGDEKAALPMPNPETNEASSPLSWYTATRLGSLHSGTSKEVLDAHTAPDRKHFQLTTEHRNELVGQFLTEVHQDVHGPSTMNLSEGWKAVFTASDAKEWGTHFYPNAMKEQQKKKSSSSSSPAFVIAGPPPPRLFITLDLRIRYVVLGRMDLYQSL
jgi:hypothetical protein